MLVFIDDAGDPGFKFSRGSSRFFVIACAIFDQLVHSRQSRTRQASFYNYIIKEVMAHDESLTAASVKLDGHAGRQYKQQAAAYFRREVSRNSRKIAKCAFADSSRNDLIQLADLVAGSIYRSRLEDRTDRDDYIAILGPRVEDIWDFG